AGGGGKGMRIVWDPQEFPSAIRAARSEGHSSFGDPAIYLEKYLFRPRHVEMQILSDGRGKVLYLGERECSIQRRHQKVVEEAPSSFVDERLRQQLGEASVRIANACGYRNAGTVEFLVDQDRNFYFLEVNARLQVEHPVTEMVTGIDLVKKQILIAAGEGIPYRQEDICLRGHAIECRIYAEDPFNAFMPSPGKITVLRSPGGPGIRDDAGVFEGSEVSIYYDPIIAKLIAWGKDREEAIQRMRRALREYMILGVQTTIPFHQQVMEDPRFVRGEIDTTYIDQMLEKDERKGDERYRDVALLAGALHILLKEQKVVSHRPAVSQEERQSLWKLAARQDMLRRR
ncbi:MAG: acetyl-CoA carboxylase biotin carboxylase subunit, partial [candidate division NC10 bacterium]|nr:acetyl-CoA carboxylase biotin carboxylase subunit [candidate division NC10 bacterium]